MKSTRGHFNGLEEGYLSVSVLIGNRVCNLLVVLKRHFNEGNPHQYVGKVNITNRLGLVRG